MSTLVYWAFFSGGIAAFSLTLGSLVGLTLRIPSYIIGILAAFPKMKLGQSNIANKINSKYKNEIKIIKNAMFKVVNENKGTAFKSRMEEIKFAGKTGTSQVRRISLSERESDDFRKKEQEWKNRDHALFVGYMPHDDPQYAISVIIEHGGSGASTAAPIAKQIFNYINKLDIWFLKRLKT